MSIVLVYKTFTDYVIYMLRVTVYEIFKENYFVWSYIARMLKELSSLTSLYIGICQTAMMELFLQVVSDF